MKKVLFATTALVATAGVASADIALSGSAQMGIQGGESAADATFGDEQETQFVQDIDITFTMSGTADNGLTFGAAIDLDENAGAVGTDDAGVAIFVSGDFGTLTLGDTDGALDWAMQEVALGGASINDNETGHAGYRGSYLDGAFDGQILRYDYSFGDFSVAFSIEQNDDVNSTVRVSPFTAGDIAGVPLGQPFVRLTTSGTTSFFDPVTDGFFVPFSTLNRMDFDLDDDGVLDVVDGTTVGPLLAAGVDFAGGNWQGFAGDFTYIGVLDTLMAAEAFADGVAPGVVDANYAINFTATGIGDALSYVDGSDYGYAIGLKYNFDTGMGDLTIGGGYQEGGTIYASQLVGTTAAGTTAIASGTDLTVDPGVATRLGESIISEEQVEYGISASYSMTNGFSAGFQYTHIENAAAMGYTIATDATSAVVTNAVFTDAVHWGIGAAYEFDAITIAANYGELDYDNGAFADRSGYGAVAQYDFGGGLSAHLGYGYSEVGAANASNWSLGLSMSF